ncbi:MAG: helix-turn-helix domain-containing protein [Oscillospiraceae bacterium]|nr:helix-turn-helix transcriptional regulator [Oscillospiraceae bacterium]MCR5306649.1 helix-turn-helix domain-containing protein [Oscillospiraceae bacterium]
MDEWKQTVAANLSALRKSHHLTQLQLADILHYSDKAVSKWERGESLPDLAVMKQLADLYGVSLDDFLMTEEARAARAEQQEALPAPVPETAEPMHRIRTQNRLIIAGMAALLVWLIATLIFVILDTVVPELRYGPFLFLYAAPITAVVCLVFNSIWFNRRWNYVIISLLVWTILGSVFLTFIHRHIWKLFLIGIPAQLIIILWSRLRPTGQGPAAK